MNRKKKYLIISINILLVLTTCLYVFISDDNEKLIISSEENNKNILNTNALTMMYETGYQSGEYQVSSDTSWPQSGYTFNATLSRCENGSTLTWDDENKKVSIQANTSDKCYVYFDKENIKIVNLSIDTASGDLCVENVTFSDNFNVKNYYLSVNGFENVESYLSGASFNHCFSGASSSPNSLNMFWNEVYSFTLYAVDNEGRSTDIYSGTLGYYDPSEG